MQDFRAAMWFWNNSSCTVFKFQYGYTAVRFAPGKLYYRFIVLKQFLELLPQLQQLQQHRQLQQQKLILPGHHVALVVPGVHHIVRQGCLGCKSSQFPILKSIFKIRSFHFEFMLLEYCKYRFGYLMVLFQ